MVDDLEKKKKSKATLENRTKSNDELLAVVKAYKDEAEAYKSPHLEDKNKIDSYDSAISKYQEKIKEFQNKKQVILKKDADIQEGACTTIENLKQTKGLEKEIKILVEEETLIDTRLTHSLERFKVVYIV